MPAKAATARRRHEDGHLASGRRLLAHAGQAPGAMGESGRRAR